MTDLTDQDRRQLREDAKAVINKTAMRSSAAVSIAQYILATVDAPDPTLAEALQRRAVLLDNGDPDGDTPHVLRDLATRAAQMEHDLTEARAQVERLTAQNIWPKTTPSGHTYNEPTTYAELRNQCANAAQATTEGWDDAERPPEPTWGMIGRATAEVERLTTEQDRHPMPENRIIPCAQKAADTPTPADIRPGEAWLVEVNREKRPAVKDSDASIPWNTVNTSGVFHAEYNEDVTLLTRLVPAPRVITDHDDLDRAKRDTIIRDARGVVCSRDCMGHAWTTFTSLADQRPHIALPATVLWEPGA